jgi:hypothetical protein
MLLILFIILLIIYIVVAYFIKIFPFTPKPIPILTTKPIISPSKAPTQSPKLTAVKGPVNKALTNANIVISQYTKTVPGLVTQFNNIPTKYNARQQSINESSINNAMNGLNNLITTITQLQTFVNRAKSLLQILDISNVDTLSDDITNTTTAIIGLTNLINTSLDRNVTNANAAIKQLNNTPTI